MTQGTVVAGGQMAPGEARSSAVSAAPYWTLLVSKRASGVPPSASAALGWNATAIPAAIPSSAPTLRGSTTEKYAGSSVVSSQHGLAGPKGAVLRDRACRPPEASLKGLESLFLLRLVGRAGPPRGSTLVVNVVD